MSDAAAYRQDIIAPVIVRHLVEFGDTHPARPGMFGYWYNFIDYIFEDGDRELLGRHYLDEPEEALLMGELGEDDFTMRVLVFLLMRYGTIKAPGNNGYCPIAKSSMNKVRARMEQHLASHGD